MTRTLILAIALLAACTSDPATQAPGEAEPAPPVTSSDRPEEEAARVTAGEAIALCEDVTGAHAYAIALGGAMPFEIGLLTVEELTIARVDAYGEMVDSETWEVDPADQGVVQFYVDAIQLSISLDDAIEAALDAVDGDALVAEYELEGDGVSIEVSILGEDGNLYEVEVDAESGEVLGVELEDEDEDEDGDDDDGTDD